MSTPSRLARPLVRGPILLLAALALAGCTSVAERRGYDEARCRSYGFRVGSADYSKCLLDLDLNRDADRRAFLYGPYPGGGYGYGGYGVGIGYGFGGGYRRW